MKKSYIKGIVLFCSLVLFYGCRNEMEILDEEVIEVIEVIEGGKNTDVKGVFLLNEGNMGCNKASIDFFDFESGKYHRNIYANRNPSVVKELGDVGNDIQIYGNKLYAVINCSHFIEVMDVRNGKHIAQIDIPNCRYITFNKGKAYVSSYAGPVALDPNARPGKVVEIDTTDLSIQREVVVGYQPEEMVILNNKIYVANSGGYRFPNYDRTISVIDINSFEVVNTIDVAINLHRMRVDKYKNIYVTSRGDYYKVKPNTYVIDTDKEKVVDKLDVGASELCISGDSIYMINVAWSHITQSNTINYSIYDIKKKKIVSDNFITDGSERDIAIPYGLTINPKTKEILVTDAKNYVTPGVLHCYTPNGVRKWSITTGDIPAHFAFTSQPFK